MIKIKNFLHQRVICISLTLAFFFVFWISGMSMAQISKQLPDQEIEAVESLVQVDEYHLNFKVIRGERFTILLEAGGGMDSREWDEIAPELARRTRATIVAYDRAGFGKSDLPETPLDLRLRLLLLLVQQLELPETPRPLHLRLRLLQVLQLQALALPLHLPLRLHLLQRLPLPLMLLP